MSNLNEKNEEIRQKSLKSLYGEAKGNMCDLLFNLDYTVERNEDGGGYKNSEEVQIVRFNFYSRYFREPNVKKAFKKIVESCQIINDAINQCEEKLKFEDTEE